MHRFFTEQSNIDPDNGFIRIMGDDVNHISHALRMKKGEQILLCTGQKEDPVEYLCEIDEIRSDEVRVRDYITKREDMHSCICSRRSPRETVLRQ